MQQPFRIKTKLFTFLLLLSQTTVWFSQSVQGQETRQLEREKKPSNTVENRVALVIGNADYLHNTKSLPNPVNDAKDISEKLKSLGFEVSVGTNLKKREMKMLINEFGTKLIQTGGVGLFFYAGHGLQYRGDNFLIPIDADILAEDEIDEEAINVSILLGKLDTAKNNLNIIMLDACRDNPFANNWSNYRNTGNEGGLAKMNAPTGTILIYATQPGNVASDGSGRNGLFTESLLANISTPNIELDKLIKTVARDVTEKSKNKQTPWKEGIILGDFYFVKEDIKAEQNLAEKQDLSQNKPPSSISIALQKEENAWNSVKNSISANDFTFFLEEFPEGVYSAQAKRMLEQLGWDSVRNSNDKNKIQEYLAKYPDGLNSASARIKLRQIESLAKVTVPALPSGKAEPEKADNDSTKTREIAVEEKTPEKTAETKPIVKSPPINKKSNTVVKKPTGKLPKVTSQTDSLGIEFVLIPAGNFMMGLSAANLGETYRMARKDYADFEKSWIENEMPAHRVEISEDYWLGKTEVTQAQWEKVMGTNPSFNKSCSDCPVERVSWEDAKEFIRKLNELDNGFVYSLPTEAEWEYAARGGTNRLFAGNVEDMAWHSGNSEIATHPVESRLPNSVGLYDMHGNVEEWCEDLYQLYDDSKSENGEAATSVTKNLRVVRGGSWNVFPTLQRATTRKGATPTLRNIVTGFRLAARLKN